VVVVVVVVEKSNLVLHPTYTAHLLSININNKPKERDKAIARIHVTIGGREERLKEVKQPLGKRMGQNRVCSLFVPIFNVLFYSPDQSVSHTTLLCTNGP